MQEQKRWLASRELGDSSNSGNRVTVHISSPEQIGNEEWSCQFFIEGIETAPSTSHGVDAFQALLTALDAIAFRLRKSGRSLMWLGHDDTGFPRQILTGVVPGLASKVEAFMERELSEYIKEKTATKGK